MSAATIDARRRLTEVHGEAIERYRAIVTSAVGEAIERLRRNIDTISGSNPSMKDLAGKTAEYLHWLSWTAWDLPQLAVVTRPDEERFRADLSASALIYFAGRLLDDYLDRHFLYRGRRETLLATLARERGADAEGMTIVMALLLCFEGLQYARAGAQTEVIVDAARGLLVGILMERSPREEWSAEFYERLIELKNVEYWRILYSALDPELASPLYPFLRRYYALAQKVNDVQDHERDAEQSRPNLAAIFGEESAAVIARDLGELESMAETLDEPSRTIALAKVGEMQEEVEELGLIAAQPAPIVDDDATPLQLYWHSASNDFRGRLGDAAFEVVGCPVCDTVNDVTIFRKQRFDYHRCATCSHIYVSPRIKAEVQKRLGDELDAAPEDEFLQTQKIYADYLCRLLRRQAPGPRLLDIGYGSGYLLRTARAHGFQVYGVETSRTRTASLDSILGTHLEVAHLGQDPLPWGSFDAVVMTHVLEHLADPRAVLRQILESLNPDGVLYLAVPDNESWQFRMFGKEWEAVNPVAHYQFFNERSLTRALRDAGFLAPSRVRMPALQGALRQRWTTLFRSLGGDESGELALMARRPPLTTPETETRDR